MTTALVVGQTKHYTDVAPLHRCAVIFVIVVADDVVVDLVDGVDVAADAVAVEAAADVGVADVAETIAVMVVCPSAALRARRQHARLSHHRCCASVRADVAIDRHRPPVSDACAHRPSACDQCNMRIQRLASR